MGFELTQCFDFHKCSKLMSSPWINSKLYSCDFKCSTITLTTISSRKWRKFASDNIFITLRMGWNVATIKIIIVNWFTGQLQIVQCIASSEVWPQTRRLQNNAPIPLDNNKFEMVLADNDWTMINQLGSSCI